MIYDIMNYIHSKKQGPTMVRDDSIGGSTLSWLGLRHSPPISFGFPNQSSKIFAWGAQ